MQDLLAQARGQLRHEPIEKRVRAQLDGDTVLDSTRAILVWEPRRVVPSFAVPVEDIRAELTAAPATSGQAKGVLHPGIPFGVHTAEGEPVSIADRAGAGFRLADDDLGGYVALDFAAFDGWYEEDERIAGHPRDPFHRVDVRQSARPVRIEVGGEVVAETTNARLLFETNCRCGSTSRARTSAQELHPATGTRTARTRARRPTGRSTPADAGARTSPGAMRSRSRTPSRSGGWWRSGTSGSTSSSTASGARRAGRADPQGTPRGVRRLTPSYAG